MIITKKYLKNLGHNFFKDKSFSNPKEDYVYKNCNIRISLPLFDDNYNVIVNYNESNSGYYDNDNVDLTCAEWQIKNLLE